MNEEQDMQVRVHTRLHWNRPHGQYAYPNNTFHDELTTTAIRLFQSSSRIISKIKGIHRFTRFDGNVVPSNGVGQVVFR